MAISARRFCSRNCIIIVWLFMCLELGFCCFEIGMKNLISRIFIEIIIILLVYDVVKRIKIN